MFRFRSKLSARANPRRRLRPQREVELFEQEFMTGGWHFKNITATDSTPKYHAVKSLGLEQRHFGEPVPLFKRLGGRFLLKNSSFQRPVEKVRLTKIEVQYRLRLRTCSEAEAVFMLDRFATPEIAAFAVRESKEDSIRAVGWRILHEMRDSGDPFAEELIREIEKGAPGQSRGASAETTS